MTYIAPYLTCEICIKVLWKYCLDNQFTTVLWVYYYLYSSARMNQFYPSVHNRMYFDSNLNIIVIWFQFFFAGDMYQNLILSTSISWIVRVWMWWRSLWPKWLAKSRDFNDSDFRQGKARQSAEPDEVLVCIIISHQNLGRVPRWYQSAPYVILLLKDLQQTYNIKIKVNESFPMWQDQNHQQCM